MLSDTKLTNPYEKQISALLQWDDQHKDAVLLALLTDECSHCGNRKSLYWDNGQFIPCGIICPFDRLADVVRERNGLPTSSDARKKYELKQLENCVARMHEG